VNAIAFDTCKAIEEPKAAGFGEARAEAMVHTVGEAFSENDAAKSRRRRSPRRRTGVRIPGRNHSRDGRAAPWLPVAGAS